MSMRSIVLVAVVAILVLGFLAWRQNTKPAAPSGDTSAQQSTPPSGGGDAGGGAPSGMPGIADQASDPGVAWTTPSSWLTQITSGMRLATYVVPGQGQGQDAECAVYYFGPGKGGGVTPNLERWVSEFTKLDSHDLRNLQVGDIKVSEVEVHGTYAEHGMQAGQETAPKEHWALLGAIAEGPTGDIFFKLTGPSQTVSASVKDFEAMLKTMKKK